MRALTLAALLAPSVAQFVPTPCFSTAACSAAVPGSACTVWRNASQCTNLNSGGTPCLSYSTEASAAAFLPYASFGAANRRTGVLFRTNLCGGDSVALLGASQFELREDFGAGFSALSADSTSAAGSVAVAVNELYRARFMLLLDLSASSLQQFTNGGGAGGASLTNLINGIDSVLFSPFNNMYAASRTQPVEFAVFAFAGDRRLERLTEWSAFGDGAASIFTTPLSGDINPAYLLSRAYPFTSDSTALFWAVPAALAALAARSAAGTAPNLYPAVMDTLVIVSDFLDTAGQRPDGALSGQSASAAFQAAASAAAAAGTSFITVPLAGSADADVPSAVIAQTFLSELPNSFSATGTTWGSILNTRFQRGVGAYVSPENTAWNANTLNMLTFCPAYTAGEASALGMELRAAAVASALPAAPTPTGLATALRYPSPPAGRCNPTQLAVPTPTPSLNPCAPPPTPVPSLPLVTACSFFAGGAGGCGRTTGLTARGLRLECPCAYPIPTPTILPTPTFEACAAPTVAAAVAVAVTSSITPPGTSAGLAILILAVLALLGLVGFAARNVGALVSSGSGGSGAPSARPHPAFAESAKSGSGGVAPTGNPLNLPGATAVQNW